MYIYRTIVNRWIWLKNTRLNSSTAVVGISLLSFTILLLFASLHSFISHAKMEEDIYDRVFNPISIQFPVLNRRRISCELCQIYSSSTFSESVTSTSTPLHVSLDVRRTLFIHTTTYSHISPRASGPTAIEEKKARCGFDDKSQDSIFIGGQAIEIENLRDQGTRWCSVRSHSKDEGRSVTLRWKDLEWSCLDEFRAQRSLRSDFEIAGTRKALRDTKTSRNSTRRQTQARSVAKINKSA